MDLRPVLLALVLAAPLAAAEPFVGEMTDREGDVVTRSGRSFTFPSSDILGYSSRFVEGTRVEQRVTMAAPPSLSENSIIARSWFRNSTGSNFFVVDLEVHGDAENVDTFRAITRRGAFEDTAPIEATWAIDGSDWVFSFDAAKVAPDAQCFLPMIYAYVSGPEGSGAFDSLGMGGKPCRTAPEPQGLEPYAPIVARTPTPTPPEADEAPTVDPPGTRTPAPGLGVAAALLAVGALALARRPRA